MSTFKMNSVQSNLDSNSVNSSIKALYSAITAILLIFYNKRPIMDSGINKGFCIILFLIKGM